VKKDKKRSQHAPIVGERRKNNQWGKKGTIVDKRNCYILSRSHSPQSVVSFLYLTEID